MKPHERKPLMSFFPNLSFHPLQTLFSPLIKALSPSLLPSLYLRTNKEASHKLPSLPALLLLLFLLFPLPKCPSVHPFDETLPNPFLF
jgi:hypothetical protein